MGASVTKRERNDDRERTLVRQIDYSVLAENRDRLTQRKSVQGPEALTTAA